ncbi:MAG: YceI family protein [Confluentibacter sp.]|nr:YceI family protein [Confluentibacter sp.]
MTATNWTVDSTQSDVLIRSKHSIVAYLANSINKFNGTIKVKDDELEDASIEFLIDIHSNEGKLEQFDVNLKLIDFFDTTKYPSICFKSISFEKINSSTNFLKGYLTINNVTKIIEFDAELMHLESNNGISKALFEVSGTVNRKDFGLTPLAFNESGGIGVGQELKLAANLEFYSKTRN